MRGSIMGDDARILNDVFAAERIPSAAGETMLGHYATIADWIMAKHVKATGPILVGVCGAQGSGKSTLAIGLQALIQHRTSLRVAVLSIDDFYLSRAARDVLADTVHPVFTTRGPPATHDVALAEHTIESLIAAQPTTRTPLPRFDKATDDTAPKADWPIFTGRADIVLLEGWCVGATPEDAAALVLPVNTLERDRDPDRIWRSTANAALSGGYHRLFARINILLLIKAPSFASVFGWRREQEQKLIERHGKMGDATMNDTQLRHFIEHYQRLTQHILREMPARADGILSLNDDRSVQALSLR